MAKNADFRAERTLAQNHSMDRDVALTAEQFEQRVTRFEALARAAPARYRFRVLLFALGGYAYLGLVVGLLLVALALGVISLVYMKVVAIKLLVPLLAFVGVVLRSLYVPIQAPAGVALRRAQAPALFERIERLRRALRAPRFHRVLVTDAFNAAVMQVPRLGLLGWHRNYLILGLPLLKCLTPEQLDAVLAHEFGHLAGGDARFSNWLYRLRAIWAQLLEELERTKSSGAFLFKGFFEWYVPRFNAYSFPLARADEYRADAVSAQLTSPRIAAQALTSVNVVGSYLRERFWPSVHRHADEQPQPSFAPYAQLGAGLAAELASEDSQRWLRDALARQTTLADSHPCLRERLAAIGAEPELAPPTEGQSADHLLASARDAIVQRFDLRWQDLIVHDWRRRYEEVQEGRRRLAELDAHAAARALNDAEALERANLDEAYGSGDAIEQFRAVLARAPDSAVANYALGFRLLQRDDAEGVALLERAMQLDADAIAPGSRALADYFWRLGDKDAAALWHRCWANRNAAVTAAQEERSRALLRDVFEPHGVPAAALAALQAELAQVGGLRGVFLARKRVTHFPERPCYVLGFAVGRRWLPARAEKTQAMLRRLRELQHFPGETLILSVEGINARFARKFGGVPGARII